MTPIWGYLVIWAITAIAVWLLSDTRPIRPQRKRPAKRASHHTQHHTAPVRHTTQKGL